jgi:hypothetical protein
MKQTKKQNLQLTKKSITRLTGNLKKTHYVSEIIPTTSIGTRTTGIFLTD